MIPYSRQEVDDDDIAAVVGVLRGDWLTTGPSVAAFERALTDYTGARHAIAVSNGTAALHLALQVADIGPGHSVATSTISFSASANCANYVGASARLVDIDPATLSIDLASVPECDALVAVHFSGLPVDLAAIPRRPRVVIEDAAQALGAHTTDGPVGNCARSDMTTFSFHPVKTITTGEGGAITTNDDDLAAALRMLRSHGIQRRPHDPPWAYDIERLGHNFRISDIQCALGISQMSKVDRFVARRNEIAARYRQALVDDPRVILPPEAPEGTQHARHLFPIQVPARAAVLRSMRADGIFVQVHHVPIHHLSVHAKNHTRSAFPEAERYYAGALSLPTYPGLTDDEQQFVVERLVAALDEEVPV